MYSLQVRRCITCVIVISTTMCMLIVNGCHLRVVQGVTNGRLLTRCTPCRDGLSGLTRCPTRGRAVSGGPRALHLTKPFSREPEL